MNHYFVSGTNRGIGYALTSQLLLNSNCLVTGIGRVAPFDHENYTHFQVDLSNLEQVMSFNFPNITAADKIVLINNAGTIGDIAHIGNEEAGTISSVITVNLTAPALLMSKFVSQYQQIDSEKLILNISSGAGKHPVDGWASYCSSKAGLNMFTQVLHKEQKDKKFPIKTFAVAPGVVDTKMQAQIRMSSKDNFSALEKFLQLKTDNVLNDPDIVGHRLIQMMNDTTQFSEVVIDL